MLFKDKKTWLSSSYKQSRHLEESRNVLNARLFFEVYTKNMSTGWTYRNFVPACLSSLRKFYLTIFIVQIKGIKETNPMFLMWLKSNSEFINPFLLLQKLKDVYIIHKLNINYVYGELRVKLYRLRLTKAFSS